MQNPYDNTDQDNLGYFYGPEEEGIDLPRLENFYGPVSESLVIACLSHKFVVIEGIDKAGRKRQIRLRADVSGRFINAELLLFGQPSGQRWCVAFKTKNGGWFYPKEFRQRLEAIEDASHWAAQIHLFHRV